MKKILPVIATSIALTLVASCGNTKLSSEELAEHNIGDSLKIALANADTMYALLYDVTVGLEQITQMEQLLNGTINSESPDTRADIARRMKAIQRGLYERRQRINELEKQLKATNQGNDKFYQRISDLRKQIDSQAQTVRELTTRLEAANFKIEELQDSITDLTASIDSVMTNQAEMAQELNDAYTEINTIYYVIGNANELKEHGFKQGGTIFKKSKLGSDFDMSYMTRADRRTLTRIPLDSKKAKILTEQPESSYTLEKDANEMLTLVITDPEAFWNLRDFLVIEVK